MKRELMRPPDVETAQQAVELLRGWIIDGHPQYSLFPTVWKDDLPSWGRFLADTANHLANAIAEDTGRDRQGILTAIATAFFQELTEGTGTHQGQFHERPPEPGDGATGSR
jgi:hypothetical protein